MHPGWYGIGKCRDVPKCALYVQHYKDTYVWVTSDGLDYLTRVTLAVLDLATASTPFTLPNPNPAGLGFDQAKYAQLTSIAKDLSQLLSQPNANQLNLAGYQQLQSSLDTYMAAISALVNHIDISKLKSNEKIMIPHMHAVRDKDNRITGYESHPVELPPGVMRNNIAELLSSPVPAPTPSNFFFRARKETFFQPPSLSPPVTPGH
jgi:hypothetical protein